jgi:hypothetical protein
MTKETDARRPSESKSEARGRMRAFLRDLALQTALRKREAGAPSYTIAEAAALCSVSQEHMYRLVRVGAFPAIRMTHRHQHGRYVIPARAVEELLADPAAVAGGLELSDWATTWESASPAPGGGA